MVFETLKAGIGSFLRGVPRGARRRRLLLEILACLGGVAVIECLGRFSRSDAHDLLLAAVLLPGVVLAVRNRRYRTSPLLLRAAAFFRKAGDLVRRSLAMEVGADFRWRKDPAPPRTTPYGDLKRHIATALVVLALLFPFRGAFPGAIHALKEHGLYTPYLLVLVGLWCLLAGTILLDSVIGILLFLHYVMRSPYGNPRAPRSRGLARRVHVPRFLVLCGLGLFGGACELAGGAAAWAWGLGLTGALSLGLALFPRAGERVSLLIKRPVEEGFRNITISEWNFSFFALVQILALGLYILSTGGTWAHGGVEAAGPMAVTYVLGRAFGILTCLTTLFYLGATVDFLDLRRLRSDPARPGRRTLLYPPGTLPDTLTVPGWRIVPSPAEPDREAGDLLYAPPGAAAPPGPVPHFRKNLLTVAPGERRLLLDRADHTAKRRRFYRGLERLLKICRAASFRGGSGFILIPHCYFVEGLHRDDRNDHLEEDRVIGPTFEELWGNRVRRFLHEVLEVMDVDMIYFEDAVRFPDLRAVFDVIFELYLNHGPRFRLEEHHFSGIPRIRVMIETIRPDRPRLRPKGYPETHFTNLSRARILMVFRDRGGEIDRALDDVPGIAVPERWHGT